MARSERKRRWDRDNKLRSMRPSGRPGHMTPGEIARLRELRAQGLTVGAIADLTGVRYARVSQYTKDLTR